MDPWIECPTITVDLDRPWNRRYLDLPPEVFEKGRRLLQAVLAEVPTWARPIADMVRLRTRNRFHDEVRCLAEKAGGDWRGITLANVIYDLALMAAGCSTIAVPTPSGPVLARNMDWAPEELLAQASYLIRAIRGGRLEYAHAGWPGAIGVVTGLSSCGFAVALNAVQCPEGTARLGYPVLLHLRRVLEDAADFNSAVQMLSEQHLAAPCLLTVVGVTNDERVVIERTPKRHGHRRAEDSKPLVVTNHYRLLYPPAPDNVPETDETSCSRYDAASRFFAGHTPDRPVDDIALLRVLTDPAVIQDITAQHVIIRPRTREIRLFVPRRFMQTE